MQRSSDFFVNKLFCGKILSKVPSLNFQICSFQVQQRIQQRYGAKLFSVSFLKIRHITKLHTETTMNLGEIVLSG
jgi:hypothetical protein